MNCATGGEAARARIISSGLSEVQKTICKEERVIREAFSILREGSCLYEFIFILVLYFSIIKFFIAVVNLLG